jgi:ATP-dependent DNA helicase DinG
VARVIGQAYEARSQQLAMAKQVAQAVADGMPLIMEAGTGTGKSLAYLAGGLAAGARIIVSTSSKALQGQLVHKDLPLLAKALALAQQRLDFTLAKGKSNYLCLLKVRRFGDWVWPEGFGPERMTEWADNSESGDLDEIPFPFPWERAEQIAADDSCLARNCQFYANCWYFDARERWADADVVVTNHALLMVDLQVPGILLPGPEELAATAARSTLLVCDEAHQLPAYAVGALSTDVTLRAYERADSCYGGAGEAGRTFLAMVAHYSQAGEDVAIPVEAEFGDGRKLAEMLAAAALMCWPGGKPQSREEAEACVTGQRLANLAERTLRLARPTEAGHVRHVAHSTAEAVTGGAAADLAQMTASDTCWEVGSFLRQLAGRSTSVVYTSATLATGRGAEALAYFRHSVGLGNPRPYEQVVGSPFDYRRQGLLYLPAQGKLPADVNGSAFLDAAAGEIAQLLDIVRGQSLLLFTSYVAMRHVYEVLSHGNRFGSLSLLMQGGQLSRDAMLEEFRSRRGRGAVILGTRSFWEGVSLEGDQLRMVVIDKVPFPNPDPVQQARAAAVTARGGNWFMDLALPEAIGALRQGAGRLIRTTKDCGVVALLDSRLTTKPWARMVLDALPPFKRSSSLDEVRRFVAL